MAGYSGTPLPRKLGIKEGDRIAVLRAPDGFHNYLGPLPDGVAVRERARGPLDMVLFFVERRAELERRFERLVGALDPAGALWIGWPKRSSGVETSVPEDDPTHEGAVLFAERCSGCHTMSAAGTT